MIAASISDSSDSNVSDKHSIIYVNKDTPQLRSVSGREYAIISPYNHIENMLDIESVDLQCRILALALFDMANITEKYATEPYIDSFNWDQVRQNVQRLAKELNHKWTSQRFFAITFRSAVPVDTDSSRLEILDFNAHQEAVASGGLLKYWFGTPDANRRNLATCIWRNPEDAKKGGTGQWHRQAMSETKDLYQEWKVERLAFSVDDDANNLSIENWTD